MSVVSSCPYLSKAETNFPTGSCFGEQTSLIKQAQRKLFLIVDGDPVHRAKIVQSWREQHIDLMEIFYLPGYSPELNPDELLNQDAKANVFTYARTRDVAGMKASLRSFLFSTQRQPRIVQNYFREKHVQYALPAA